MAKAKTQKKSSTLGKNKRGTIAKSSAKSVIAKTTKKPAPARVTLSARIGKGIGKGIDKGIDAAKGALGLAPTNDLIALILEDHKRLKELIAIMKNSDLEMSERETAFDEFAPALLAHSRPEEKTLYASMKSGADMREDAFEGDVEHGLADQMVEEVKRTDDVDLRSARLKVLAELVSHHIKEEEEDMIPEYRKAIDAPTRVRLGEQFLSLKAEIESEGADDAPPEAMLIADKKTNPLHA